ncbi:hypothetical protein, partial [Phaeodactylibacter luteus]|uniref:hypothetical protein n=1 Tax=Phaeodactylibacter luteus TaxID=1564516 RepID=UPI001478D4B4
LQAIRMKINTVISILLICALWSCKLDKEGTVIEEDGEEPVRIMKPPGKYFTDFENEDCKIQIDSAKIDVENGRLVYEDTKGGWSIIRYDDEMEEILKEYGIEYVEIGPNCTLEQECYGYYMDSIISQRFGKEFIKQIEQKADSLFLSRWKTKTYEYWDIDESPSYKGDAEVYIENRVKPPLNWDSIPMEFERQFIIVEVTISNKGNLDNWEFDEFYNLKESNEQFLPELKSQISQIIKEMEEWTPGKLIGKDVNSKIWLDIDLDKER